MRSVGQLFFPNDDKLAADSKKIIEDVVAAEGQCRIVGWREVPVDESVVGRMAKRTQPRFMQASINSGHLQDGCKLTVTTEMPRQCWLLRRLQCSSSSASMPLCCPDMLSKTSCHTGTTGPG